MSQYAIVMYGPSETEESRVCSPEYDEHSDELVDSGGMVAAFELARASAGAWLRGDVVTDGPFIEAKEVIVGICVIEAADFDAALAVARVNPILGDGGRLEVRPVRGSRIFAVHDANDQAS
jgi:hypothetical protein